VLIATAQFAALDCRIWREVLNRSRSQVKLRKVHKLLSILTWYDVLIFVVGWCSNLMPVVCGFVHIVVWWLLVMLKATSSNLDNDVLFML
jgi:hypothetical protein